MATIGKILKTWTQFFLIIIMTIALTGCTVANIQGGSEPLLQKRSHYLIIKCLGDKP